MSSLYKKTINGKPYYYLREMARVDGKPKMVNEDYLGSAADIGKPPVIAHRRNSPRAQMPEQVRRQTGSKSHIG